MAAANRSFGGVLLIGLGLTLVGEVPARAQVPAAPAAAPAPVDDRPTVRVGGVLFADYTVQQRPTTFDADGNEVTLNAFNIGRAYVNVTGTVTRFLAFRITPDIARETGTGSSLSGSYTFRLKYAYAQFNLDEWVNPGSWVRLGMQQTPWVDFMETAYRYRFQGTVFADREGFVSSSDVGVAGRYHLPGNFGDVHAGIYNGETYARPEVNDQKGFMVRGTVRPLPEHAWLRGLRLTGFYDHDAYVEDAERRRGIVAVTFEHKYLHAAFDYLSATDQTLRSARAVNAHGFSAWATPRTSFGLEGLLRYDRLEPDDTSEAEKTRTIAGVAYWLPTPAAASSALLLDVEHVTYRHFAPERATERRFALHMLLSF